MHSAKRWSISWALALFLCFELTICDCNVLVLSTPALNVYTHIPCSVYLLFHSLVPFFVAESSSYMFLPSFPLFLVFLCHRLIRFQATWCVIYCTAFKAITSFSRNIVYCLSMNGFLYGCKLHWCFMLALDLVLLYRSCPFWIQCMCLLKVTMPFPSRFIFVFP